MNTAEFLSHVRNLGVNLWVDGDDLRYSAPKGVVTQALHAELVERKAEILAFLRATDVAVGSTVSPSQTKEARPEPGKNFVAPRTPTEEALARIWAEVLGPDQVSVHDNFFELGGDSITSIQLSARANQAGIQITPWQIFEHQTITELAAVVGIFPAVKAEQESVAETVPPSPLVKLDEQELNRLSAIVTDWEDVYPLSPMQQGMLFHTLCAPGSGMYVEQTNWTLHGDLDIPAFKHAWQRVLDRHPILRTVFLWEGWDEPLQVVRQRVRLSWDQQDWRGLSLVKQQERLESFLRADREQEFELSQAPLMRLTLIQVTEDTHQLVWTHHHSLFDGWSAALLRRDVFAFYEAFRRGEDPHLEQVRPYRDYIAWLQRQNMSEAETFWRQVLSGFIAPTPLVVDKASEGTSGDVIVYDEQRIQLSATTTDTLRFMARQHRLTLNTLVQGAWALLLSRYSGETDVVFGVTVSGRPGELAGVESMVGLFVNTLPVRVQVPPGAPLLSWLKELQTQQIAARRYEYSPLVQIQKWSDVLQGRPLFESFLVFQNLPADILSQRQDSSLEIRRRGSSSRTNYPLHVQATPGSEISLSIHYHRSRFDVATIAQMLGHFQTLLEGMVANPDQQLSAVPLLTETERHQLLVEWNNTKVDYPKDLCIHELFEAQVERTPDVVAVVFEDQKLTYRELNRRANRLAYYLQGLEVEPETLVGICAERSLEMVIGLLGILKAGGAYVPLDPTYPRERLAFMLEDTQIPVLLIQQRLVERLPAHEAQIVCLDADWETIAQVDAGNPAGGVISENIAYMIYTSGSTGKPKGAMNTHRGICNRLLWMQDAYYLTEADRVLQKTPFSFDVSVWEFFWPLLTGAKLVVVRPEGHKDPAYLVKTIIEQGVTTVHFVPSMLRAFLEEPGLEACVSLKRVICSGEVLPFDLQERFFERLCADLHNLYGPTEAAVDATFWACQRDSQRKIVPIGRPIANTQIYLLDQHLNPVPVGVPGELHIGGTGLARGYLNRPVLTTEKFIPNPFSDEPDVRLYKTGDLARYLPDGNTEFLGRIDRQVKIRGFRIELGEIEAALVQHARVRETVVLAREDKPGDKRLVAYVVPDQEQTSTVSELRSFSKKKLPEYMVPSAFVFLDRLPLMPNGKVDRWALPVPDSTRPDLEQAFVAPRTLTEETLADIWAQVLGVEQVGIHDNFFELGGDSLLGLQVISRVNQAGLRFSPQQILEHQTIAELAMVEGTVLIQAEQGLVTGLYPLTNNQRWFFDREFVDRNHWNVRRLLQVHQALDPGLVEETAWHIVTHHDALRTRFLSTEAGWQASIVKPDKVAPFIYIDLSELSPIEHERAIEQAAGQLAKSLDILNGPVFRVALFDLGAQRPQRLLIIAHHQVADGVSLPILLEDFETVYKQLSRGEQVRLLPKTTSIKEWAERLHAYAQSAELRREVDYWLTYPWVYSPIPVDYPEARSQDNTEGSCDIVQVGLSAGETNVLLQEIPRLYNVGIVDALLMALVQAMTQWTGGHWAPIIVLDSGRGTLFGTDDMDLSRTVGLFVTGGFMILEREEAGDPGDELVSIRDQIRHIPNRGLGFELLLRCCEDADIREKLKTVRKNDVKFNYLGQFRSRSSDEPGLLRPAREFAGAHVNPQTRRDELLYCESGIGKNGLFVNWWYSKNLHKRTTIEGVADDFVEALRALITHCRSQREHQL